MKHGIIHIPCIAVRTEPSEQSEMSSQLLFGEIFEILEGNPGWLHIRNEYDTYTGWINRSGTTMLDDGMLDEYRSFSHCIQSHTFLGIQRSPGEEKMLVPAGSVMYFRESQPLKVFCGNSYRMEKPCKPGVPQDAAALIRTGKQFLNTPYLWGGKSSFGCDCSGLVQTVMKIHGVYLERDTSGQVNQGTGLNMLAEARTGDLVFFDNEEGEIVHVGLLMEPGMVLHASGSVRIDPIDHQGIYSRELKRYTHKLRVIKRIIENIS